MKDPEQNHFVKFHHEEDRIAALEADLKNISMAMLAYLENYRSGKFEAEPGERLVQTFRDIVERME